ncbi:AN1-type zinc finger protein 1 isoform X2 [Mixophyes fleayi]|uniref:AN1-type zinc finger protein 1 isoform X2 n=1 Tax=Mixophyes fleayi TaxID=3061075 RepID=UPI003F4E2C36
MAAQECSASHTEAGIPMAVSRFLQVSVVASLKGAHSTPVHTKAAAGRSWSRHRHQSDHECEKLEALKPRMSATQQLVKEIVDSKKSAPPSKVRRGAKNAETAAKVALMKLKLHAVGDKSLPQSERVYFQVYLPQGGKEKSKPMFFCKKWSIGKVVDYAATLASLKNDNNKAAAKKLRVCHAETGETLPLDSTIEVWLSSSENPLYNGGKIIIEYLDNECNGIEDTNSYFI